MDGKEICRTLKQIRKQIAEANGLPIQIADCTYDGPCRGTCDRCESEMWQLRVGLEAKKRQGEATVIPQVRIDPGPANSNPPQIPRDSYLPRTAGVPMRPDWEQQPPQPPASKKKKRRLFEGKER